MIASIQKAPCCIFFLFNDIIKAQAAQPAISNSPRTSPNEGSNDDDEGEALMLPYPPWPSPSADAPWPSGSSIVFGSWLQTAMWRCVHPLLQSLI